MIGDYFYDEPYIYLDKHSNISVTHTYCARCKYFQPLYSEKCSGCNPENGFKNFKFTEEEGYEF